MHHKSSKTNFDQIINEALKTAPEFILPDNFADVVAQKMEKKFAWQQYIIEFSVYLGTLVGLLVVTAGIAFLWYDANWSLWFSFLQSNIWVVAGINFLLLFVLFTDRVLLPYYIYKARLKHIN